MISPAQHVEAGDTLRRGSWLTTPLTGWQCVLGWFVATGVFVGVVLIAGGPAVGDAYESIYATWGIQHLQLVCMYPPHPISITTYAAPGYPIISGIIDAFLRVGHGAPYPTGTALGHECSKAVVAMVHWSKAEGAIVPTLRTAYVSWVFLLVGLIWLVRAGGRGRSGWEPLTLLLVACLPPVWLSIEMYFHPQDIVAIGFALAATACALRNHWIGAGVLIGCAVLTQQYTLLVAIPLLVVAPSRSRWPYAGAAVATGIILAGPILLASGKAAAHYVFYGSGAAIGAGGTVVWELHLHGLPLLFLSRITPLALSFAVSWCVVRRVGASAREPVVLIALLAVSLSLRLIFEQNVFGYYYLALMIMLLLLDVFRGRIREAWVAWVAMVTLVWTEPFIFVWRQSWNQDMRRWLPIIVMAVALFFILRSVSRHRVGWNTAAWGMTIVTALVTWPVSSDPLNHWPIVWLWQTILVTIGVALAAGPLWQLVHEHSTSGPAAVTPERVAEPALH